MAFVLTNPTIDIALIAIAISLVSLLVQRKVMGKGGMKEKQRAMKERQKQMTELMKRQDEQAKNELKSLEKEMMDESMGMMQKSMKHMVVIMVIVVPTFWFLNSNYGKAVGLPIGDVKLPLLGLIPSAIAWYIVAGIVASLILNFVIGRIDKPRVA